jgi:hypothetical protein
VLAKKEMTLAISKDTLKRTEAIFKKQERVREGAEATLEYEAEGRAVREKTARLRALRLAAEAVKEDAEVKAAAVKQANSTKKAARKAKGGAKPNAEGKTVKVIGKKLGSKKDALTST